MIGNLTILICQYSTPYVNLSEIYSCHTRLNVLKCMLSGLVKENAFPDSAVEVGGEYALLFPRDSCTQAINDLEDRKIVEVMTSESMEVEAG